MRGWRSAAALLLLQLVSGVQAAEEAVVGQMAIAGHGILQQLIEYCNAESERLETTSMLRHVLEKGLGW